MFETQISATISLESEILQLKVCIRVQIKDNCSKTSVCVGFNTLLVKIFPWRGIFTSNLL